MRINGRRYRDDWVPNAYPPRPIGDQFVSISRTGKPIVLSENEATQLYQISMNERLFQRLERSEQIITADNAQRVMQRLQMWHRRTFAGPSLHIVVLTKRCNLDCTYCHMYPEFIGAPQDSYDLRNDVAQAIIRFALSSPNPRLTFEFQGGEPFLNFSAMKYVVEEALRQNKALGKEISFAVTTNLMVVDTEHMEFCQEHGVAMAYSLNGPPDVHDHFRITRNGSGSFDAVSRKLETFRSQFPNMLNAAPLCVVGPETAPRLIELMEWYYANGFHDVAIIRLKPLGNVRKNAMPFDASDFIRHYIKALDHIYDKNRDLSKGPFSERLLRVALAKVFNDSDIGFVDWRNPNGDFSCAITYDYDGTILPMDEARSLRPRFELGNALRDTYDELIRRDSTFETMNLSVRDRDPVCRNCSWNPYCGVLPVLDYARTGDPVPRPHDSPECLFVLAIFDWLFRKMLDDAIPLMRMLPGMEAHLTRLVRATELAG